MSWTYDPALLSDKNLGVMMQVRLMIGDTDPDYAYMQDEEILFYINQHPSSVYHVAITCLRRIIAKVAKEVNYKIGPEKVDASDRMKHMEDLLGALIHESNLENISFAGAVVSRDPVFDLGMNDNPSTFNAANFSSMVNGCYLR